MIALYEIKGRLKVQTAFLMSFYDVFYCIFSTRKSIKLRTLALKNARST